MTQACGIRSVGYFDCAGGGQVVVDGTTAYVAHMAAPHGTTLVDVSDPAKPRTLAELTVPAGRVVFILHPDGAPNACTHFVRLVNDGFYEGLTFHRREEGFVLQGGDPNGDGTGGPEFNLRAEPGARTHQEGTVAMARSTHRDSAGSQFYFCLAPAPKLDEEGYTVFGQVVEGMDAVHRTVIGSKMKLSRLSP